MAEITFDGLRGHHTLVNIMEEPQIDHDVTDNVKLTVREEIHETLVDFHSDKKIGGKCNLAENLIESVVKIIIIDADDFGDDTGTPDRYRLGEIWSNIQPLTDIYEIKQNLAKDLSLVNVPARSFCDFNLACMSLLKGGEISLLRFSESESESSIHNTLEKSLPLYYLASLFVHYLYEYTENVEIKKLLKRQNEHLQNVCNVFENALEVNGWSVPDLATTREKFNQFQARLPGLADQYIKSVPESRYASTHGEGSGSELLRQHKQLVINYEIVSEIEYAITSLRDVFGTINEERLGKLGDGGSFGLYEEVTERSTIWK
ncbi:Hypothetical predicted protein [Paramuricea clavata]|uniref:Uncharacterized protein n=1 Tax=Paramuricea clavata TaxID=317549 RepID=A0A7D9I9W5_PARCT|nr:Hypothetical predicted protein [Paramuricea clavata]